MPVPVHVDAHVRVDVNLNVDVLVNALGHVHDLA
jgi:hypothetical protein